MKNSTLAKWCLLALFLFAVSPVFAGISGDGLLDDVTKRFFTESAKWGAIITKYASWLFWVLATISMVWTFGTLALRKADIGDFFSEFLRFTITTGFFWWLLSNGPAMAISIINSLRQIGAEAGGVGVALTPSTPITVAFDIVKKAFVGLSWVHPIDNLGILLISLAVVLCMAIVAANVLIALVTAWVLAYAGCFVLGFGGSRWTSDMAIGYFKAILAIGLELMTMTLLLGIAISVIDGFYAQLDGASVYELLLVFTVCAVLALVIDKIPHRVAALSGGGGGAGTIGAGSVLAAAAIGAAAAASAGAALAGGATSMAGGASALMEAFKSASASENGGGEGGAGDDTQSDTGSGGKGSEGGLSAAMGDSGGGGKSAQATPTGGGAGGGGGSAGSGSAESAGSGSQPSAAPGEQQGGGGLAKAGRIAVGTAANLAKGTAAVAKDKANRMMNDARERIGETTGGKIAAAIRLANAPAEESFGENSLGAGTKPPGSDDPDSEVAAFVDRGPNKP